MKIYRVVSRSSKDSSNTGDQHVRLFGRCNPLKNLTKENKMNTSKNENTEITYRDIVDQINDETDASAISKQSIRIWEDPPSEEVGFHSPIPTIKAIFAKIMNGFRKSSHKSAWAVLAVFVLGFSAISVSGGVAYAFGSCSGYKVEKGDTLWAIAQANGTDVATLSEVNAISDVSLIHVGDCIEFLSLPMVGQAVTQEPVQVLGEEVTPKADVITEDELTIREKYYAKAIEFNYGTGYDSSTPLVYSGATKDLGVTTPGAYALAVALQGAYPDGGFNIDESYGIGTYAGRNARGSSSLSTHAEGRAVDFYYSECSERGYDIFTKLVDNAQNLGIARVIYCGMEWRAGWDAPRQTSEFLANQHNGTTGPIHFHIELTAQSGAFLILDQTQAVFPIKFMF